MEVKSNIYLSNFTVNLQINLKQLLERYMLKSFSKLQFKLLSKVKQTANFLIMSTVCMTHCSNKVIIIIAR